MINYHKNLKNKNFHQSDEDDDGFVLFIFYCHDICNPSRDLHVPI